jgi:hypothetical protein
MKHCPRCDEDLPLSEFGVDRSRKDGLNLYCRFHARERARNYHARHRVKRKPCKPVSGLWRTGLSPKEKVLLAIKRGARTQTEIRRATRLYVDDLTDALADLYVEDKLDRGALRQRQYVIAA